MVSRSERVLITGGSGFTGRPLAERLRQDGHEVLTISHQASAAGEFNVDLRDFDGLTRTLSQTEPMAIVHLAGIAAPSHSKIDEMYSANIVGTANLFAALAIARIEPRIVIVASSAQVYAVPDNALQLTEDSPLAPRTDYGVSKRAAEEIASIHSRHVPIIITRPFNYTGPGQTTSFLVPKIVRHYAEKRSEIRVGNMDLFRDFSDISRVVEAYSRLVSRSVDPVTVNICSGRTVHLQEILQMMEEISDHHINVITDSALVRNNEPRTIVGCPARIEALVGPLPNPEFCATLRRMYEFFCERDLA